MNNYLSTQNNKRLPQGKYAHNLDPERLLCPVCYRKLTPNEKLFENTNAEHWSLICTHCQTEYFSVQPIGRLHKPLSTSERIKALEERIATLENIIQKLMKQQPQSLSTQITEERKEENITSKYAFLLKV